MQHTQPLFNRRFLLILRSMLGAGEQRCSLKPGFIGSVAARRRARGFTLIELMVTVVIIGVLAALAGYSITEYVRRAKTAEPREIIGTIMAQEEEYFTEVGKYLDVTGGTAADSNYYPAGTFNGNVRIMWGGDDTCQDSAGVKCRDNFRKLGVMVNTPVIFRYAVTTMAAGETPEVPTSYVHNFNPTSRTAERQGYVVVALSDLDQDGAGRTAIVGSSLAAQLYMEGDGE